MNGIETIAQGRVSSRPSRLPIFARQCSTRTRAAILTVFAFSFPLLAQPPSGWINTIAGTTAEGYSGDGGPATLARFRTPSGMAFDGFGNLYIADTDNNVIRRITKGGIVTTVAGNGSPGYSGDGGPATSAQLDSPTGIAFDSAGRLYIADWLNNAVRRVAGGIITTVAGTGTAGYNGDGQPATSAQLNSPIAIAFDTAGNLYISDLLNFRIREVTSGTITTVAGNGADGETGDGGPATSAQIHPGAIAIDSDGNLYIGSVFTQIEPTIVWGPPVIRKVSGGTITSVAGLSGLHSVFGFAINSAGNLVVNDPVGSRVYELSNGTLRVLAGNGTIGFSGDGGPAPSAQLAGPALLVFDINGNLYISDFDNDCVRIVHFPGSMPHIAAEGVWTTTFTTVNNGPVPAHTRLDLFDENGGPLTLTLALPQQNPPAEEMTSYHDATLATRQMLVTTTAGPTDGPYKVGSALQSAAGMMDGFAIFHLIPGAQEAVVPMETRDAPSYLLAFDNTNGVVLGVAIANISTQAADVPVIIRDDTGAQIGSGTISLLGSGHSSFVLSANYPVTANGRGTVEFDTPPGGRISVLGIRTTPLGSTFTLTTIPVLANVGKGRGSIAHIAVANGWKTTFVLINAGSTAAQAHLKFFADDGSPLSLPLSFPQSGDTATAASIDNTLAAGATLTVESTGPLTDPVQIGSAQLTTDGHVSGFVIFRYEPKGQEAVVPLEKRKAATYILAFDNTGGTATGIAVNNVSALPQDIPVVLRSETGATIATDTLSMAANGHSAFTLGVDRYPMAAGIRGTIEFFAPSAGQIGALGIRIPAALTFTTLPAMVR